MDDDEAAYVLAGISDLDALAHTLLETQFARFQLGTDHEEARTRNRTRELAAALLTVALASRHKHIARKDALRQDIIELLGDYKVVLDTLDELADEAEMALKD